MTLMELLVVLVILAVVATIAVQSLQPRIESARFEQTRTMLQEIQTATNGDPRARRADGSPLISGFISDVGRGPLADSPPLNAPANTLNIATDQSANPGPLSLRELWDDQSSLVTQFPFQFRPGPKTPVDCSDIQLACGWRGPYLSLPLGRTDLFDPWSRPFELEIDDQRQITKVIWQPIGEFQQDLSCDLSKGKVTVSGNIQFGQNSSNNVQVVLLIPDPQHSLTELKAMTDLDPSPTSFLFEKVPIGLRAIRMVADDKVFTKYVEVPLGGLTFLFDADQNTEPRK